MTVVRTDSIAPDSGAGRSIWRDAASRLLTSPMTVACLFIVAIYVVVALLSFTPYLNDKVDQIVGGSYEHPGLRNFDLWLGADILGRSVIWRVLYGARVALEIAVTASAITIAIGVVLGVLAGYFGGWVNDLITWLFTTVSSVPWILLVLALVFVLKGVEIWPGQSIPELWLVIIALGFTDWVGLCRLMRGEVIKHRERDYVQAARAAGLGHVRIVFRHILPNTVHIVIINFTLGAIGYVQAEVALTFLGLGISEKPSWGRMIDDAKLELLKGVWWQAAAATVAIAILCLALNMLGDALRDALDPRLRGTD